MNWLSFLSGGLIGNWIGAASTPNAVMEAINQTFNKLLPLSTLPLEILVYARSAGLIDRNRYVDEMTRLGFEEADAELIYVIFRPKATVNELIRSFFYEYGGKYDVDKIWQMIDNELMYYGYDEQERDRITKSYKFIPSLSDLLQWMAKEAFEDDMARALGLDEEFPKKFKEYAAKLGIPEEDALRYWRAHWSTPGWTQVAEAFHRARGEAYKRGTYESTMRDWEKIWDIFYRQAEVPKFWRDLLTSITYNVITRVDARRMYELGFIDKKELAAIYMQLGYTKEDAELMADWVAWEVQRYDEEDLRGLTKSQVDKLYKLGIIADQEYIDLLMKIGYGKETAEYYLQIMRTELFTDTIDKRIEAIKKRYIKGNISREEVYKELLNLGIDAEIAGTLLASWDPDVVESKKELTKEDIKNALRYNVITLDEAYRRLIGIGYSPDDAKILLATWGVRAEALTKVQQAMNEAAQK